LQRATKPLCEGVSGRRCGCVRKQTRASKGVAVPLSGAVVEPDAAALERLKTSAFDPQQTVLIAHDLTLAPSLPARAARVVEISSASMNGMTLRSQTAASSILVISQIYYPGWQAYVDGQGADLLRVNYALSGVVVPAGSHEVRLVFAPRSFRIGMVLTVLSA